MNNSNSLSPNKIRMLLVEHIDVVHIIILLTGTVLLHIFFHFTTFVTSDMVRYAIGFKKLIKGVSEAPFNEELSFGYYQALLPIVANLSDSSIPIFLNSISIIASILIVLPLYFLIKDLFSPRIAFLTVLFLTISPPYWLLSRYGHPTMFGLFFFVWSIATFNRATDQTHHPSLSLALSIVLAVCALFLRVDLLLIFAIPIGILFYKKQLEKQFYLLSFYSLVVFSYLGLRWGFVGYILKPGAGTVQSHFQTRLISFQVVMKSIIKNTTLFTFGLLPLLALCLLIAIVWFVHSKRWRLLVFLGLWLGPMLVFLPFWGMDFSRLSVPALPAAMLAIVCALDSLPLTRFKYIVPIGLLALAHLLSLFTTPLVARVYPFKNYYQGQPITSVPIQQIFIDYFVRNDYVQSLYALTEEVVQYSERDVVIITNGSHVSWYQYALLVKRQMLCSMISDRKSDLKVRSCPTSHNDLLIIEINWQSNYQSLLKKISAEELSEYVFHINPFMLNLPVNNLFLEQDKLVELLTHKNDFIDQYQEILRQSD